MQLDQEMLRKSTVSGAALLIYATMIGNAAANCNPRDFMVQDIDISNTLNVFRLSYLNTMSREKFEENKKSGKLSGVIPGVKIPASMSYDDFRTVISSEFQNRQLEVTQLQMDSMFRSRVSPQAADMYIKCLTNNGVSTDISAPQEAMNSEEFFLTLTWRGPIGVEKGKFDLFGPGPFMVLGGEIAANKDFYNGLKEIKNGQNLKIPVKRDLNKAFSFTGSVEGYASEINIPSKARPSTLRYEVAVSNEASAFSDWKNDWNDTEGNICINAKSNEIFLPSTAQVVDTRYVGEDRGRVWSKIMDGGSSKILCLRNHAHVSRRDYAAAIVSHIEVLKIVLPETAEK